MGKPTKAELRAQPPNEDAEQREQRKFDRALREIARLQAERQPAR